MHDDDPFRPRVEWYGSRFCVKFVPETEKTVPVLTDLEGQAVEGLRTDCGSCVFTENFCANVAE